MCRISGAIERRDFMPTRPALTQVGKVAAYAAALGP